VHHCVPCFNISGYDIGFAIDLVIWLWHWFCYRSGVFNMPGYDISGQVFQDKESH
jgi:hypothetical protein